MIEDLLVKVFYTLGDFFIGLLKVLDDMFMDG